MGWWVRPGWVARGPGGLPSGRNAVFRDPKPWEAPTMGVRSWIQRWPALRQISDGDPLGRGRAAQSARSASLTPRTATADRVARSVCPYCAVGCAQKVYVKDDENIHIEGDDVCASFSVRLSR